MRSPLKNVALSSRLTKVINEIISGDGRGDIDGVQFDFHHERLDQNQWSIVSVLEDIQHLPNEFADGVVYNKPRIWFPWFGKFDDKTLRSEISKLDTKKRAQLIQHIEPELPAGVADQDPVERLITLRTPKYFVDSGDTIAIRAVAEMTVGGDHLHEHDRLIKKVSLGITKGDGAIVDIEPSYEVIGNQTLLNLNQEMAEPFGSVLFRIVHSQNLEQPNQLRKLKGSNSELSIASAIAYDLYKLIEPAWDDSDEKNEASSEEIEEAEDTLHLVNEATLLGYLWAKIEFEANLKPLADIAKQRRIDNKRGGEESGRKRREKAELGWKSFAKELAADARREKPSSSQDAVAEEIMMYWRPGWPPRPKFPSLKKLVGQMERSGELPRPSKRSDI
jgi:hypothetical protein